MTVTHKCHSATNNCALEEVNGSGNIEDYIQEASIWISDDDDDELAENKMSAAAHHQSLFLCNNTVYCIFPHFPYEPLMACNALQYTSMHLQHL